MILRPTSSPAAFQHSRIGLGAGAYADPLITRRLAELYQQREAIEARFVPKGNYLDPEQSFTKITTSARSPLLAALEDLHLQFEAMRTWVTLVPAPDPKHQGHMIRVREGAEPEWYSELRQEHAYHRISIGKRLRRRALYKYSSLKVGKDGSRKSRMSKYGRPLTDRVVGYYRTEREDSRIRRSHITKMFEAVRDELRGVDPQRRSHDFSASIKSCLRQLVFQSAVRNDLDLALYYSDNVQSREALWQRSDEIVVEKGRAIEALNAEVTRVEQQYRRLPPKKVAIGNLSIDPEGTRLKRSRMPRLVRDDIPF